MDLLLKNLTVTQCIGTQERFDELTLRRLLAVQVAGAALYCDDGELQDNSMLPYIDFLRDSPSEIEAKLRQRNQVSRSF